MKLKTTIAVATAAALTLPPAAGAHVTLQPREVPAGGFARLDVRVPNERDDVGTTKVQVQLPDGFPSASYEPVPGWTVRVAMERAPEPIEQHGEQVTEQVDTITFTGDGRDGIIKPGEFQDFGLSLAIPDEPGKTLTFKAVQTYEGGEVVRWIGAADSDEPAPQVKLIPAAGEPEPAAATATAEEDEDDDEDSGALAAVALGVGALGLLAGVAALVTRRRPA